LFSSAFFFFFFFVLGQTYIFYRVYILQLQT